MEPVWITCDDLNAEGILVSANMPSGLTHSQQSSPGGFDVRPDAAEHSSCLKLHVALLVLLTFGKYIRAGEHGRVSVQ